MLHPVYRAPDKCPERKRQAVFHSEEGQILQPTDSHASRQRLLIVWQVRRCTATSGEGWRAHKNSQGAGWWETGGRQRTGKLKRSERARTWPGNPNLLAKMHHIRNPGADIDIWLLRLTKSARRGLPIYNGGDSEYQRHAGIRESKLLPCAYWGLQNISDEGRHLQCDKVPGISHQVNI